MRTVTWLCRFLLVLGCLATIAQPVEAQRRRSANNEAQQKARTAYARGQELFQAGQFEEAKTSFTEAFDAVPNPVVLLSVAECEIKLSQLPEAVTTLERYLALREDAPDRAQVEAKITAIKETPATLVITSDAPGARITLDGADTGKVTPAELQVAPGAHVIQVAFPGEEGTTQSLTARYGQRHEMAVELGGRQLVDPFGDAPAAAPASQTAPTAEASVESSGAGPAAWVLASVGAAGIVTGTVLGFMALSAQNDFDEKPTAKLADKGERLALFTDVAFGVGAVCLITGLVLAVTAGEEEAAAEQASEGQSARLRVTPIVTPSTAALSAQLQF